MSNVRENGFSQSRRANENRREGKHGIALRMDCIEKPYSMMQPMSMSNHHMQIFNESCSPDRQQQVVKVGSKTKVKKAKLLSSKSLSRLVPRNLFFKKNPSMNGGGKSSNENQAKLTSTKSFPSALRSDPTSPKPMILLDEPLVSLAKSSPSSSAAPNKGREDSNSLVGLPRQSTCNLFHKVECSTPFSKRSQTFSPILGAAEQLNRVSLSEPFSFFSAATDSGFDSSAGPSVQSTARSTEPENSLEPPKEASKAGDEKRKKYKSTLKSTTLVLRDVKNSLGLRMKARHESQAFAKLTNERTSPPTKLYSPFNIYADSASKPKQEHTRTPKRKPNLTSNKQVSKTTADQNCSMMSVDEVGEVTPKQRVASQHKKHLVQASKFIFDSPAGRLKETVKDVERFQQCIEDISKAIRARDRSV